MTYEIRLVGPTTGDVLDAYAGAHLTVEPGEVTMCARVTDQAALHGLLAEARLLGLEVVAVRVLLSQRDG